MKNKLCLLVTATVVCLIALTACRQERQTNAVDRLPELPQDLAATLDPKTNATKISVTNPDPGKPGVALAPCCSSSETKKLKVKFAYTKCGPLRDFILAPFTDLVFASAGQPVPVSSGGPAVRAFKFRSSVLDQWICVTSEGPWDATFIEDRHCAGYTPQDTLIVTAFGSPVTFYWSGGPANHPQSVQLVSCRDVGTTRFNCGISNCQCISSSCPPTQPCDCTLQGW